LTLTLAARDAAFARESAAKLHGGRFARLLQRGPDRRGIGGREERDGDRRVPTAPARQNARAALIIGLPRSRAGMALGGAPETFMGLPARATGSHREATCRATGASAKLAKENRPDPRDLGHVAEGVRSKGVAKLAAAKKVDMPITQGGDLIEGRLAAPQVERLLMRDAKPEA
jgi:hypothetical protein